MSHDGTMLRGDMNITLFIFLTLFFFFFFFFPQIHIYKGEGFSLGFGEQKYIKTGYIRLAANLDSPGSLAGTYLEANSRVLVISAFESTCFWVRSF